MKHIYAYSGLIKEIPVVNQSAKVKREIWGRLLENYKEIEDGIFSAKDEIEVSRYDVFSESDTIKKTVM